MALASETFQVRVLGTVEGAPISGGAGVPEMTITHQVLVFGIPGYSRYSTMSTTLGVAPPSTWFLDGPQESKLEVDTGGGFTLLVYGVDYINLLRGVGNLSAGVPPTTADCAIGFQLLAPATGAETFRFTWYERRILCAIPTVAVALLVGGPPSTPDNTIKWKSGIPSAGVANPNGISVPPLTGINNSYLVEFWRLTRFGGGLRGIHLVRGGRRYVPYYRGAVDVWYHVREDFAPAAVSNKKQLFRVCYYNPSTGARSELSSDVIERCQKKRNEQVHGSGGRGAKSVWVR